MSSLCEIIVDSVKVESPVTLSMVLVFSVVITCALEIAASMKKTIKKSRRVLMVFPPIITKSS